MEAVDNQYKNKWAILGVLVMMPFVASLDSSIVNVALPIMSKSLSVDTSSIAWVVTSYLIAISATIIVFGRISDIVGKSKVFNFGIFLFTIGSLMCGISSSLPFLIFSRIVQGIGAAGAMATNQGIITNVFPPNQRGRALGISGTFVAIGSMIGAPLGGIIVSAFSWHYIFLINLPVGIIASIIALKILPKDVKKSKEAIDIKGAVLFTLFIVLLFSAMINGQQVGYENTAIIVAFLIAIVCFILFIKLELKVKNPLLELNLFRNKLFSISLFCAFTAFLATSCLTIIFPFYLQGAMKFSPGVTGFIMMIAPIILSFVSPISGYLSDKLGSEVLSVIGLSMVTIGLFLMTILNEHTHIVVIVVFIAITAIGNGLFQSPNTSLIMSLVPTNKLGIAGSTNALTRNLGMVFGTSLSTTILYNRMSAKAGHRVFDYTTGRDDIFIYGMKWVFFIIALICLVGAVVTGLRMYSKRKDKALNANLKN